MRARFPSFFREYYVKAEPFAKTLPTVRMHVCARLQPDLQVK